MAFGTFGRAKGTGDPGNPGKDLEDVVGWSNKRILNAYGVPSPIVGGQEPPMDEGQRCYGNHKCGRCQARITTPPDARPNSSDSLEPHVTAREIEAAREEIEETLAKLRMRS